MAIIITGNIPLLDTATCIIRARGAADMERTEGAIAAADWIGFNPLTQPRLVAG